MTSTSVIYKSKNEKLMESLSPRDFDRVLYHKGCPDGIGGAFPFWMENKDRIAANESEDDGTKVLFRGIKRSDDPPYALLEGKRVICIDFCFSPEETDKLSEICEYIIFFDHHITDIRKFNGYYADNVEYLFDTSRAASQIAWEWVYPNEQVPWFINVIADRDLWKWELPYSKEIGKSLYHFGWYRWDKLYELYQRLDEEESLKYSFRVEGIALMESEKKETEYACSSSRLCIFEGYKVRLTTCHPNIRSEVGNRLANMPDCDFAAIWRYFFEVDEWRINLRCTKSCKTPINRIAEKFGGGGHSNACAFTIHGPKSPEKGKLQGTLRDYFDII